jgi:hypothetical protein
MASLRVLRRPRKRKPSPCTLTVKPITVEVGMHSDSALVERQTLGNLCNLNRNRAFIFHNMEWRGQRQRCLLDTFPGANEFTGNSGTITIMVTA